MNVAWSPSVTNGMLARVVERIREATSFHGIAHGVIAELAGVHGVRDIALVLCDAAGEPALWIGDRGAGRWYLDGAYRDDALFARVRTDHASAATPERWVAPLLGDAGVIGMLRVGLDPDVVARWDELTTIAVYVSIRLAMLGGAPDDGLATLTPRQREVAELVAHGCTNHEIAQMLAISANAVKKHVSRVLAALEVSNRTELAALTGRWRTASGSDEVLPPTVEVVLRNQAKVIAGPCRRRVA